MGVFVLERLSTALGVPLDQVTFFVSQILVLHLSWLLKKCFPPCKNNVLIRHIFEIFGGIIVMYLCYEERSVLIIYECVPAYIMLVFLPTSIAQYAVLLFTLAFLSCVHIERLFSTYAREQSVDITAPLMIITQKLSSLAFNLSDGIQMSTGKRLSRLSHEAHAISKTPRLLPMLGYIFCFQNSLVGPFIFYSDYLCYIEGREEEQVADVEEKDYVLKNKEHIRNAKSAIKRQGFWILFHLFLAFYASGRYDPAYLISAEFQRLGIFRKYFWLTLYGFYLRQKFYCAWSLSAMAMLVSGFGFSGFARKGSLQPEYINAINVRFFNIEFGLNTKEMLDNWNMGTMRWLRECVYDRTPKRYAVVAVFFASAFWHGFYLVYYFCFLSAALLTMTGRLCRARLRPCFVDSYWYHRLYDILTNMGALFSLNYLGMAFSLLDTTMALKLWGSFYYLGHLVPLLMLFLLPYGLPSVSKRDGGSKSAVVDVAYEVNLDTRSGAATVTTRSYNSPTPESKKCAR